VAPSVQRRKIWLTSTTRCRAVTLPSRIGPHSSFVLFHRIR